MKLEQQPKNNSDLIQLLKGLKRGVPPPSAEKKAEGKRKLLEEAAKRAENLVSGSEEPSKVNQ